jgi:hypothetical protein
MKEREWEVLVEGGPLGVPLADIVVARNAHEAFAVASVRYQGRTVRVTREWRLTFWQRYVRVPYFTLVGWLSRPFQPAPYYVSDETHEVLADGSVRERDTGKIAFKLPR